MLRSRTANALIMAMGAIAILAGLSLALSDLTVGRYGEQLSRQDQVKLMAAAESAANETIEWLRANETTVLTVLNQNEYPTVVQDSITSPPRTPQQQYERLATLPTGAVLGSANPPSGSGQPFPALAMTSGAQVPGCGTSMRNGAGVECKVVCIKKTEPGNVWPDGFEKFLVFATATQGNIDTRANMYRRARVQAVVSTSSLKVFQQGFFARQKYTVTGSLKAASWPGNGTAIVPKTAASSGHGVASSTDVVTVAGSAKVDSTKNNVNLALPPVIYNPPAGTTALGGSPATVAGGTSYRITNLTGDVTVSGSGKIAIYVDNTFNPSNIKWAAGSTADVVIFQSPNASGASGLDIKATNQVGYLDYTKSGGTETYKPKPSKLMIVSGFKGDWTVNGSGDMAAVIYAPYANVKMNGTAHLFGAIIADSFDSKVNGTFDFWYDDTLGNVPLPLPPQLSATGWNQYYPGFNQQ